MASITKLIPIKEVVMRITNTQYACYANVCSLAHPPALNTSQHLYNVWLISYGFDTLSHNYYTATSFERGFFCCKYKTGMYVWQNGIPGYATPTPFKIYVPTQSNKCSDNWGKGKNVTVGRSVLLLWNKSFTWEINRLQNLFLVLWEQGSCLASRYHVLYFRNWFLSAPLKGIIPFDRVSTTPATILLLAYKLCSMLTKKILYLGAKFRPFYSSKMVSNFISKPL